MLSFSLCQPGPTGQSPFPSSSWTWPNRTPNRTGPSPIPALTGFVAFVQPSSPYKTSVDRPRLLLSLYPRKKPPWCQFRILPENAETSHRRHCRVPLLSGSCKPHAEPRNMIAMPLSLTPREFMLRATRRRSPKCSGKIPSTVCVACLSRDLPEPR